MDARDASIFRASCPLVWSGHSTLCSADSCWSRPDEAGSCSLWMLRATALFCSDRHQILGDPTVTGSPLSDRWPSGSGPTPVLVRHPAVPVPVVMKPGRGRPAVGTAGRRAPRGAPAVITLWSRVSL